MLVDKHEREINKQDRKLRDARRDTWEHTLPRALIMRTHCAPPVVLNSNQGRRRSNSNSNVEFQKVKCKILFTVLESSSNLRSSAFIALNDPSVVLDDH